MDRYGLAREFELAKFEMTVMKMTDLYQVQEIAIKLFSQTLAQRRVYEELLRDVEGCRRPNSCVPAVTTGTHSAPATVLRGLDASRQKKGAIRPPRLATHLVLELSEELALPVNVLSDQLCESFCRPRFLSRGPGAATCVVICGCLGE